MNALCGSDRSRERTLCVAIPAYGDEKIVGDVAASGSAAEFAVLGGQCASEWLLVVRNVCASRRMEYVKSKGLANPRWGRKTSGVAREA
jgi:hypothetical protein